MAETMDPILVKGLREAKQLHDDGILSLQEFEKEKQVLLQKPSAQAGQMSLRCVRCPRPFPGALALVPIPRDVCRHDW